MDGLIEQYLQQARDVDKLNAAPIAACLIAALQQINPEYEECVAVEKLILQTTRKIDHVLLYT